MTNDLRIVPCGLHSAHTDAFRMFAYTQTAEVSVPRMHRNFKYEEATLAKGGLRLSQPKRTSGISRGQKRGWHLVLNWIAPAVLPPLCC